MKRLKPFRRGFIAFLSVIFLLSAAIVSATVKLYTATAEDYANEVESQDIAKLRARDKAIKNATKQAGVYLKSYSRSVNSELTDDEITAIASNAWQLVGEPKYSSKIVKGSDETSIIIWTATVEVNVDDSEIQSWIKRDDKDKSTIITQTREAQKVSEENERKIEDLREKYNRATSQAERDSIIKQMNDADRDFLANQKFEEANKLYYEKNYHGAIKLYDEVLKFGEYAEAYNNRGNVYQILKQYERAIQDYNKALELNPNLAEAYNNRGFLCMYELKQYERAIQDFDKAIQLDTKYITSYANLAFTYYKMEQFEQAIQSISKVIELMPNEHISYECRAEAYCKLKNYKKAIVDLNKAIELSPNYVEAYQLRGICYQELGDEAKAQADFKKAKELGYKG